MNKVILMGRLTRDPELRYSQGASGTAVCRYGLAVQRSYKRDNEPDVDFINIVAFGNRGEFAGKYFKKGMMVAVVGELRISSYTDQSGNKRTSTDVVVSEQYFAESKQSFQSHQAQSSSQDFAAPDAGNYRSYQKPSQPQAARPQQAGPAKADQPAGGDGFEPIDTAIEGDEDLPF